MKKCPHCNMTVDAKSECPICRTTLTYEPYCTDDHEHLIWNKHLLLYLAKNIWFSVLCYIVGTVKYFMTSTDPSILFLYAAILALISLLTSIFHRPYSKILAWKYSDNYIPVIIAFQKYVFGGLSIIFFILS